MADFVASWLGSLGLGSYAGWFREHGVDTADRLVAWASQPKAELEAKIDEINKTFPDGVLTNKYGHGALFRSSLAKVVDKIRRVSARAKHQLESRVTLSGAAKDDPNDAFGPLQPGETAVVVDVAFPTGALASYKVQCADGGSWWYAETSIEPAPTLAATAGADSGGGAAAATATATAAEDELGGPREERLSTDAIVSLAAKLRATGKVGGVGKAPGGDAASATGAAAAATTTTTTTTKTGAKATAATARPVAASPATGPRKLPPVPPPAAGGASVASPAAAPVAAAPDAKPKAVASALAAATEQQRAAPPQERKDSAGDKLKVLMEEEEFWLEAQLSRLRQDSDAEAAPGAPEPTLPQVSIKLARAAGVKKQVATRKREFFSLAEMLVAAAGAERDPRLEGLATGAAAMESRFAELGAAADERQSVLDELKATRLDRLRRKSTPSVPMSPVSPPPTGLHLAGRRRSSAAAPPSLGVDPDYVEVAAAEPASPAASVGRGGGPCVVAFRSIDDATLNRILRATAGGAAVSVAEYSALEKRHVDAGDGVAVARARYGAERDAVAADVCVFFDVDYEASARELAGPRDIGQGRFHNVSSI